MEAVTGVSTVALDTGLTSDLGTTDSYQDIDTLGHKFFELLSDTKDQIATKSVEISEALSVENISPADLIRLQFQLAEITIQQELVSKGVSKSTQNVDTLLKAQ